MLLITQKHQDLIGVMLSFALMQKKAFSKPSVKQITALLLLLICFMTTSSSVRSTAITVKSKELQMKYLAELIIL